MHFDRAQRMAIGLEAIEGSRENLIFEEYILKTTDF